TLTTPGFINGSVTALNGTALDAPAGVASLQIALSSAAGAGSSWWDGSSFSGAAPSVFARTTYNAGSPDTWTWNLPALTNGVQYLAQTQTVDNAGNARTQNQNQFYYDTQAPVTGVQAPIDGQYYHALPTISGTGLDNVSIST